MSHTPHVAPGRRRAAAPARSPRRPAMLAVLLAGCLVAGGVVGALGGHASRDDEVAALRADLTAERAAAGDARQVAEDQVERAADAGSATYEATALARSSAAGADRARARTRAAERNAAACRSAMRTEMENVTVLLDILDRDDPTYTLTRLPDVDADEAGIRRCVRVRAVRRTDPPVVVDPPAVPPTVLARTRH